MRLDDNKNVSWIIKHRPNAVSDVVGEEAKQIAKFIANKENTPHFLFASRTPGTGKTTLAKAIINDLGTDYLEINSSMDRSIDNIRTTVKFFVSTKNSTDTNAKKIVFLDEFDGMLKPVQDALRNLMETYAHNVIFILTCNYIEKIIEPIKNRCEVIIFGNPKKEDIKEYLMKIIIAEEVKFDEAGLDKLINMKYPSIRDMVGELQKFKTLDVELTEKFLKKEDELYDILWENIKQNKVLETRKAIYENNHRPDLVLKHFWNKTHTDNELSNKHKLKMVTVLAEADYRMSVGSDKKIQIDNMLFKIYAVMVN